jgi:hypothetical protein
MAIPSILTIGESGTGSALRIIVRLVTRQRVERARMEIQYRLSLD